MPWGTTNAPGKKSKAKDLVTAPAEHLQGQFARASKDAAKARHDKLVTVIESIGDKIATGLAETLNGIRVTASRPVTVVAKSDQRIATSSGRLIGWSLANSSTANAVLVRFRAGRDVLGDIVAVTVIPAGGTSTMRVGSTGGVSFGGDGLTLEVLPVPGAGAAGVIEGAVHIGAVD